MRAIRNGMPKAPPRPPRATIPLPNLSRTAPRHNWGTGARSGPGPAGAIVSAVSEPARYEQVTREQIRKVALRVFNPDHRTVGVLVPTDGAEAPAGKEAGR